MTRKDKIQKALASVYCAPGKTGKGGMVESCAVDLDKRWETLMDEDRTYTRGPEAEVQMQIWNWFPGGGTAQIAAERVMAAVNDEV